MGLAEATRHYVKGFFHVYILIFLAGALLPFVFQAIDDNSTYITAPEIVKWGLATVVLAFVLFQVLLPGLENFRSQPPKNQQFDGGYNSYPGPGGEFQ